jgi:hypothetical protein
MIIRITDNLNHSTTLGIHRSLTYLPHEFMLVVKHFVTDCHGFQVSGAMDIPPSERTLLID